MIGFGTSAYLKVLGLNPKPRSSEIRRRLSPSNGGYDFHKTMRRIVPRVVSGAINAHEGEIEFQRITKTPEREAAQKALETLREWQNGREIRIDGLVEATTVSRSNLFSVKFSPDFWMMNEGKKTLVHLWNTQKPQITYREVVGALGLFAEKYENQNLAVLCLRSVQLYVVQPNAKTEELSHFLMRDVERRITIEKRIVPKPGQLEKSIRV